MPINTCFVSGTTWTKEIPGAWQRNKPTNCDADSDGLTSSSWMVSMTTSIKDVHSSDRLSFVRSASASAASACLQTTQTGKYNPHQSRYVGGGGRAGHIREKIEATNQTTNGVEYKPRSREAETIKQNKQKQSCKNQATNEKQNRAGKF